MPFRAPQPCRHPGCPKLVPFGNCPDHQQPKQKRARGKDRRPSARKRGYDRRHEAWRAAVLRRDPWCRRCTVRRSEHADHITPIRKGGARFDLKNGQGLCQSCHNAKTAREDR